MNQRCVAPLIIACLAWQFASVDAQDKLSQQRISLTPKMVMTESDADEAARIVDEQNEIIGPPAGAPESTWKFPTGPKHTYPHSAYIDLGNGEKLATLWIFDTNGTGKLQIDTGKPGTWTKLTTYGCGRYRQWVEIPVDRETRYLRLTRMDSGANFSEIAIYRYTPDAWQAMRERKAVEARAEAERMAALQRAREEIGKRPLIDAGDPFGKLHLIEEIDTSKVQPVQQGPASVSRIENILGKPCRVIAKTDGQSAYFSYRIGKLKLLQPGKAYVLEVEYPEDAPRSIIVMNGANETSSGFHTGTTFGDALYPKYVNNLNESLDLPLSGKYETWATLFHLHDRTPNIRFIRGDKEPRELTAEDGFTVTIAQFSAENIPFSRGAAVSRIRLYAVANPGKLNAEYQLPEGLPHRKLFWREEMSDGVVGGDGDSRGVINRLDWWKFKRNRMKFLGFNTFTKDLLEFGAVQHWDTTAGGGNDWAYFNSEMKDLWPQIVSVMGEAGFGVMPYYEYSGSKGAKGLGNQRRSRPLRRDDAYSHISWVESANADITDPDTYADFQKMLDLTVINLQDRAHFAGAWIRSRGQLPMSFADATLQRFAMETRYEGSLTRQNLIDDGKLLASYKSWWNGKRRQFLTAMRDHLRQNGIADADILYTTEVAESGVPFPTWDPIVVADNPDRLKQLKPAGDKKRIAPLSIAKVKAKNLYLKALTAERLNWGGWELDHRDPPPDPDAYKETDGVLLTHAFNRLYTVSDPATFDAFRTPSGVAIVRHFALNEHMVYDTDDKPIVGYFIVDMERAGPYCMMAEAYAVAVGDPTNIGYLSGGNFNRGFSRYVRSFNTAFLSLPALPSQVVPGASIDPDIVVRRIRTKDQGDYFAVVSLGKTPKQSVTVRLPSAGAITDATTDKAMSSNEGQTVKFPMHPFQLRAIRVR